MNPARSHGLGYIYAQADPWLLATILLTLAIGAFVAIWIVWRWK